MNEQAEAILIVDKGGMKICPICHAYVGLGPYYKYCGNCGVKLIERNIKDAKADTEDKKSV